MRGDGPAMPFALQLLKQHWNGATVEQLSRETGIPPDRVEVRLKAAEGYLQRLSGSRDSGTASGEERRRHGLRLGVVIAYG